MQTNEEIKKMTVPDLKAAIEFYRKDAEQLEKAGKDYAQISNTWLAEKVEQKRQNSLGMANKLELELASRSNEDSDPWNNP